MLSMRVFTVLIVVISLLIGMGQFMSPIGSVNADTSYYESYAVSSNNSTYWYTTPRYPSSPVPIYEAQVYGDGNYKDLYASTTVTKYIETNDFTNPLTYTDWYNYSSEHMPVPGANITEVKVLIKFTFLKPETILHYSINGKSSWNTSSTYHDYLGNSYSWDITSFETWTPEILNGTDLWVKAEIAPDIGIHYYLDYLGLSVTWSVEEAGGSPTVPPTEEETGGAELDYDIVFTAEGIIGVLGFVGLIGMIAVPALGVFVYRQNEGEGKMNIFIKMLALFMFCLTFFMVAVTSA